MTLPPGSRDVRRVAGGDINEAYRVTLRDGRDAFVKTRDDPHRGEYLSEAAALGWLDGAGAVAVPAVLDACEEYLVLEWIAEGRLDEHGAEELGRRLARLHDCGAPAFGDPGSLGPARFASIVLPNQPADDWPAFYADRRLRPLARLARDRGAISARGFDAVEGVCARMSELAGPSEPPARLHGDLWSGNLIADAGGRTWLIDPSSYGGSREVDLAMLRLFGAPHLEVLLGAYERENPLAAGWEDRVELYQLMPLLVHAVLFGGSYGSAAERVARRYAGA